MRSVYTIAALFCALALSSPARSRDKVLSRDEIITVAKAEMSKYLPWLDTAEFDARKGGGVFGWTVFAYCTNCTTPGGKPKREMAIIKLDRYGRIIEVEPPE